MRIKRLQGMIFLAILFFLAQSAGAQSVTAASDTSEQLFENPRQTVHTFLYYQQEASQDFARAAQTMKLADNLTEEQRIDLAQQLKRILDARGLLVHYERIPDNPNYTDSLSGRHQYTLFSALPNVYLVKQGDKWLFSQTTIETIPDLYSNTFSIVGDLVDELPDSMQTYWLGLKVWQYLAIFIWLLIGLVLRKLFEFLFDSYARKLVEKTQTRWDDLLVEETERPISFLFMIGFFWATFTNLMLSVTTNYYLSMILNVAFLASFVWLFYNLTNVLTQYLEDITAKTESKLDDQLVPLIRKTLKVFVVVIGIIFILQNNGINVTSLLAGLGLGGLAIALAAKDTLANFFGSITIFTDQPFQVGDLIKTSNAEGVVEEVGFRSTRLRTLYDSDLSVPNSILANTEIDNLGRRRRRRLNTTLNLTYDTSPEQIE
ncbi:MAG: mechanosensitive ion channel, partial [Balneolaceae bacterium]|nr:mechanosensitive ion channel [Balneolaceae bacterium]